MPSPRVSGIAHYHLQPFLPSTFTLRASSQARHLLPRCIISWSTFMADLSSIHFWPKPRSPRAFSLLSKHGPCRVHWGDPSLSRLSVCSLFRLVSGICAHCSHPGEVICAWMVLGPLCLPDRLGPYLTLLQLESLATKRGHYPCCGSLRSVPESG